MCQKCQQEEVLPKGGWMKIKQTKCPVHTPLNLKQLLIEKHWLGVGRDSRFWVEFNPYHLYAVRLMDILEAPSE